MEPSGRAARNGQEALQIAQTLSFPRLSGTPGEKKAALYIENKLQEFGYQPRKETFLVSLSPWKCMRIFVLIALIILGAGRLLSLVTPLIAAVLMTAVAVSFASYGPVWLKIAGSQSFSSSMKCRQRKREKPIFSQNLVARLPPRQQPRRSLTLVAHYDSKSQNLSILHRAFFILMAFGSFLWLAVRYYLAMGQPLPGCPSWESDLPLGLGLWALISILLIRTGNRSRGALDNAAAVGVLLQIAARLQNDPPRHTEVTFLFSGAEEWGALGAFAYLQKHGQEIPKENTFFLNLDGVGIRGATRIFPGKSAFSFGKSNPPASFLEDLGRLRGIRRMRFSLGILMDHHAFLEKGYPAATLACVSPKALVIHTPADTADQIELEGLIEVQNFILDWIQQMDYK